MIRVVNMKYYKYQPDEYLIKVDRTTPLGNPFYMSDESQRDSVCNSYREYFNTKLKNRHPNFILELKRIYELHRSGVNVALGCWCKLPDKKVRCHADTIKEFLDYVIENEELYLWLSI